MKKIILLILFFFLVTSLSFGGTRTLNFVWNQDLPDPKMAGWKFYQSFTSGGPWTLVETIPYISPQVGYTTSKLITVPDGVVTMLYFTVTAFDISGNELVRSNEIAARINFQSLNAPPVQFWIVEIP